MKRKAGGAKLNFRGTEAVRFWRRVKILENGCWQWTGLKDRSGYGRFSLARRQAKKNAQVAAAHRWAYSQYVGPIAGNAQVHHKCENPSCVNPIHLEQLTALAHVHAHPKNAAMVNKAKTVCKRGHQLEYFGKYRKCRTCINESSKRRRNQKL